ncbi:MAG: alpha/beta hydrolase [Actinomyces sp.]|nr:alpha/beta hydrolase [Actinomyces sp.]
MAYIGTDDSSGDPVFQEDSDVKVRTYQRGRIRMVYAVRDNRVEEHAPDPSRPVFVMIHGVGMGRRALAGLARELAPHGTAYTVDLPGFGDSPTPKRPPSMAQYGKLVAAFIRDNKLRQVIVIGHSMGTQVAVEVARQRPDLIDQLVLIAPTINPARRTLHQQTWDLITDFADDGLHVMAVGVANYLRAGPVWFFRTIRAMMDHRVERIYPQVPTPTLVMRGEDDLVCPHDWTKRVAQLLPHGTYASIEDHGHEAVLRDAVPATQIILDHVL